MPNNYQKEKKEPEETPLSWDTVDSYIQEGGLGGSAMALIETEKILGEVLKRLGFPGKNTDQRIESARSILSNFNDLSLAREACKKLISDVGARVSPSDAKEILPQYYQAIKDLIRLKEYNIPLLERIKAYFRRHIPQPKKFYKRLGLSLLIFFFVIFVLDSTQIGHKLVSTLIKISHFIFSWVLFAVLLLIGVAIIVVGSLFFFESRKKRKTK